MNRVDLYCGVRLLYFGDADNKTGIIGDAEFRTLEPQIVPSGNPLNFRCNAADFLSVQPDQYVIIGFPLAHHLRVAAGIFRVPLTILKMCIYVRGEYRFLRGRYHFASDIFQWPAAPGERQWLEGPIAGPVEESDAAWIPVGSSLGFVIGLYSRLADNPDGTKALLSGALRCYDRPVSGSSSATLRSLQFDSVLFRK
jgi:hypothetical protein